MAFSFIHCADLHLDAVLGDSVRSSSSDNLSTDERIILRDAPLESLEKIMQAAVDNEVNAVIIAGDIFDSRDLATKNQRVRSRFTRFLNTLHEHNISVFIALGNHDPIRSIKKLSASWPNNVHIFSSIKPETILRSYNGHQIAFHGVSYEHNDESRILSNDFPQAVEGAINIGVFHTNVAGNSAHKNYAPSTVVSLTSHNYNYFALGHIHKRTEVSTSPLVAYSGNTQGLSAKTSEQDPKGCVLVSIDDLTQACSTRFIDTDSVRYLSCKLKADEFLEADDIVTYIAQEISTLCDDPEIFYLVRASIDVFGTIDAEQICYAVNDIRQNYFVTDLSTMNSYRSFNELVEENTFYTHVLDVLAETPTPTLNDLYGSRSSTIAHYLDDTDELYDNYIIDVKSEAADVILATASEIEQAGKI